MSRCLGTKRDNSPCTIRVELPKSYCWWHDPANAQARKQLPLVVANGRAGVVPKPSSPTSSSASPTSQTMYSRALWTRAWQPPPRRS